MLSVSSLDAAATGEVRQVGLSAPPCDDFA
jgi:hypothetical protein